MSTKDPIKKVLEAHLGKIFTEASCGFYRAVGQIHSVDLKVSSENQLKNMTFENRMAQQLTWESQPGLVFDLASLTKVLFTAPKIFQLACEKGLSFNQPIESFLGEALKSRLHPNLRALTLAGLLGHTSGLPAWGNLWVECESQSFSSSKERLLFHLNRLSDSIDRKRGMLYSDIGYLLLGLIIESETNKSLRECLSEWNQQSGARLSFSPSTETCASTGFCSWRKREIKGEVHDENCSGLGGACGHTGLFGSLRDVEIHLKWLFSAGFGGAFFHQNALLRKPAGAKGDGLLGLRQGLPAHAKSFARGQSVGHLGFTGTSFWIDPENFSFYVLLTNRVSLGRLSKGIMDVRAEISTAADSYFRS